MLVNFDRAGIEALGHRRRDSRIQVAVDGVPGSPSGLAGHRGGV